MKAIRETEWFGDMSPTVKVSPHSMMNGIS
jgi:hypothetical protein